MTHNRGVANETDKTPFKQITTINGHYYEMVALTELKNKIRSGDIAVTGSRNYKNFDEYLISNDEWNKIKYSESKLALSMSCEE
nr:hypothetical protein [uncultured Clostridium sp.]